MSFGVATLTFIRHDAILSQQAGLVNVRAKDRSQLLVQTRVRFRTLDLHAQVRLHNNRARDEAKTDQVLDGLIGATRVGPSQLYPSSRGLFFRGEEVEGGI